MRNLHNASIILPALCLALLSGCNQDAGVIAQQPTAEPSTPSPSASSSAFGGGNGSQSPTPRPSSIESQAAAVIKQYRTFFNSITPLSRAKPKARYEAMKKLAVDPELSQVMGAMAAATQAGEVGYGQYVLRPKIQKLAGADVTLLDCQDSSGVGRMNLASGRKVTVGRKNDYAQVTMKRGDDEVWRVATVGYAAAGSCSAGA